MQGRRSKGGPYSSVSSGDFIQLYRSLTSCAMLFSHGGRTQGDVTRAVETCAGRRDAQSGSPVSCNLTPSMTRESRAEGSNSPWNSRTRF